MKACSQVFLFQCHFLSGSIINEFQKISDAAGDTGDSYILYCSNSNNPPEKLNDFNHFIFSQSDFESSPYFKIGQSFIPGHGQFPILKFYQMNPSYDFYWFIEYDTRFSGNWKYFFTYFDHIHKDFITSQIRRPPDEPGWHWWRLVHPSNQIPSTERLASFNPIYRISNKALAYLHQSMEDGWRGHSEVLMPSLLSGNNFTLMDFGKNDTLVPGNNHANFYSTCLSGRRSKTNNYTVRYRPYFLIWGLRKNKLYHPVKPVREIFKKLWVFWRNILKRKSSKKGIFHKK